MGFFAEASLKKIGASLTASFILTVGIFYGMQLLIAVEDVELNTDIFKIADVTMPERELELIQDMERPQEEEPPPETCLLYTSPSPRDATLSRMPSSA